MGPLQPVPPHLPPYLAPTTQVVASAQLKPLQKPPAPLQPLAQVSAQVPLLRRPLPSLAASLGCGVGILLLMGWLGGLCPPPSVPVPGTSTCWCSLGSEEHCMTSDSGQHVAGDHQLTNSIGGHAGQLSAPGSISVLRAGWEVLSHTAGRVSLHIRGTRGRFWQLPPVSQPCPCHAHWVPFTIWLNCRPAHRCSWHSVSFRRTGGWLTCLCCPCITCRCAVGCSCALTRKALY